MIVYKKRKGHERGVSFPWREWINPDTTRGKITLWAGVVLVAFLALYVIMNNIVMPSITRHGDEFSLPSIVGMTVAEAEPVLHEAELYLEVTSEEYHPDKPSGTILTQFPIGGTMVKSGRTIKVVTSLGQKLVAVPDLRGFSVRQARLNLEAAGFELGDLEWTTADSLPEKVVVFSYPRSGVEIPYGSEVNLMVNRGPYQQTVFVPRLIGLSLEEARARLEEKGLKVGLVTTIINENYLPETVMEQSEIAGSELLPGEEVDIVISSTD